MKGRTEFGVIGWSLLGLAGLGVVIQAFLQIKTGHDVGYRNAKNQPMIYLGALATFGVGGIVGSERLARRPRPLDLRRLQLLRVPADDPK